MKSVPSLWNFSCEHYGRADVEPLCVQLQDSYTVDIPLLFFCIWSGYYIGQLTGSTVGQALSLTKTYSQVCIEPLRSVRRHMKAENAASLAGWEDLRQEVNALELRAERALLESLQGLLNKPGFKMGSVQTVKSNIQLCYPSLSIPDVLLTALLTALALGEG
ncbi:MAG: TIGR02444 family protein [Cellvibrionaceae bacterium]|nr:TIGR02444 family protein [Cellvibrionaceae bacterium]